MASPWLTHALRLSALALLTSCSCSCEHRGHEEASSVPQPTVVAPSQASMLAARAELERAPVQTIEPVPLVEVEIPEPPPPPFAGREQVSVEELLEAMKAELPALAESEALRTDYEAFRAAFELEDSEALYLDFVRVSLAFEATRDGGWWGLQWKITNEQPNSEKIWAQWRALELTWPEDGGAPELPPTTAIAECDELSALFAFFARRLGLSRDSHVGLFWPTGNHVVAVWIVDARGEDPTRVVIPTTQIFLEADATLGDRGFNPWKQRTIYDYRRQDIPADATLPGPLASYFIAQLRQYGDASQAEQLERMNERMNLQMEG